MENKDKPAFAAGAMTDSGAGFHETGLTKREFMAAMAMQGILGCPNRLLKNDKSISCTPEEVAEISLSYADELLKHLDNGMDKR